MSRNVTSACHAEYISSCGACVKFVYSTSHKAALIGGATKLWRLITPIVTICSGSASSYPICLGKLPVCRKLKSSSSYIRPGTSSTNTACSRRGPRGQNRHPLDCNWNRCSAFHLFWNIKAQSFSSHHNLQFTYFLWFFLRLWKEE